MFECQADRPRKWNEQQPTGPDQRRHGGRNSPAKCERRAARSAFATPSESPKRQVQNHEQAKRRFAQDKRTHGNRAWVERRDPTGEDAGSLVKKRRGPPTDRGHDEGPKHSTQSASGHDRRLFTQDQKHNRQARGISWRAQHARIRRAVLIGFARCDRPAELPIGVAITKEELLARRQARLPPNAERQPGHEGHGQDRDPHRTNGCKSCHRGRMDALGSNSGPHIVGTSARRSNPASKDRKGAC